MSLAIFDLTGKVAIVTGASRGIGKAIALGFAQSGADVVVAARSAVELEKTAALIQGEGRRALAIPTDVTQMSRVSAMLEKTLDVFQKVDILVNNAGGASNGSGYVSDLSPEAWLDGIELNLNSLFYCSKIVGAEMVKRKTGNIINISSGMGFGPFPGASHHAAARAGVINFTRTLALEWAPFNIRVNSIAPGYIETDLPAKAWRENPGQREALIKNVPLGRIGRPEEMAAVAIFLASPAASFITGETINANGGLITSVSPGWFDYCQKMRGTP